MKLLITQQSQSSATFSSVLFSNTLNLCSSIDVRYQVSHPYTIGKIMILCF